jgi:hypothetical protein
MNNLTCILLLLFIANSLVAQEIPPIVEQQAEDAADVVEETGDETYFQLLQQFKKNPIDLNVADADMLKELQVIPEMLINNLLSYRKLMGPLLSIYELQAVPGWSFSLIQRIRTYITVRQAGNVQDEMKKQLVQGEHLIQFRISQVIDKALATNSVTYLGSNQKIYFRYRYHYKNNLQFGFLGDRDAGEQFFKGSQKTGFDFYSFHFQVKKVGILRTLVLGDFSVNMGQGLIQWQSLAFKKGSEVMSVKRESPVLKAYNSAGEFYFHRGVGLTIRMGKLDITAFFSRKRLSANIGKDTINNREYITSFLTGGYHRTATELESRKRIVQTSAGGSLHYNLANYRLGLNAVHYIYSLPIERKAEPYNLYSVKGPKWSNFSIDQSFTWKNSHWFGELAFDNQLNKAFLVGVMLSADPKIDLSFIYRSVSSAYQALSANAFTEGTQPNNESGIYAGMAIRLANAWQLKAFVDIFHHPWLKFQVNRPSEGSEFMVQLLYTPHKGAELYCQFRWRSKAGGGEDNASIPYSMNGITRNLRLNLSVDLSRSLTFRARAENLTSDNKVGQMQRGFLIYSDILFWPNQKSFKTSIRLQFTETTGYDSRIYAYENDGTMGGSVLSHWGKCFRYYLTVSNNLKKKFTYSIHWAHSMPVKGSPALPIMNTQQVNGKAEIKLQLMLII